MQKQICQADQGTETPSLLTQLTKPYLGKATYAWSQGIAITTLFLCIQLQNQSRHDIFAS
jgi:hypothetical protein